VVYGSVNASLLAANADRERALDVLRAGFVEGRLTQEEFNERVARAYASRTYGQLGELTADLPAGPVPPWLPAPVPSAGPRAVPSGAGIRPAVSISGLLLIAVVVFTLAALVTAIALVRARTGQGILIHAKFAPAVFTQSPPP
jgi:hypothetical protein